MSVPTGTGILDNPEMDKETRIEFVKDIKREIININFLVNSILKLSKLDANSVKFINKEISLQKIVNENIGIGLALAKSIIESNNGYIDVESEINKGTMFTIKYFK